MLRFDYSGHGLLRREYSEGLGRRLAGGGGRDAELHRPAALRPCRLLARRLDRASARAGARKNGRRATQRPRADRAGLGHDRETDVGEDVGRRRAPSWRPKASTYAPSNYDDPYPITKILIEEGRNHLVAEGDIPVTAPVRILQGMRDEDVPWEHARALVDLLRHGRCGIDAHQDRRSPPLKSRRLGTPCAHHRCADRLGIRCRFKRRQPFAESGIAQHRRRART